MMHRIHKIDVMDELNIYLVANGLKPASSLRYGSAKYIWGPEKIDRAELELFKRHLTDVGISYEARNSYTLNVWSERAGCPAREVIDIYIGKDSESLDRLCEAETDKERGVALGYPMEAISAFGKVIDGEKRDGYYYQVRLAEARQAGIILPIWLAYISHVPEDLDFLNGKVSETSRLLGEKYCSFVKDTDSGLAQRVESRFEDAPLPTWTKASDGSFKRC